MLNTLPEIYQTHAWIRPMTVAFLPQAMTPALKLATEAVLNWLRDNGSTVQETPDNATELLMTTGLFGQKVDRNDALMFHAKRRYPMLHRPPLITFVDIAEDDYQQWLKHFAELALLPPETVQTMDVAAYPGLGPEGLEVLALQARRGGPEVALGRFLQTQLISLRVLALRTSHDRPHKVVNFDLAGAHPTLQAENLETLGRELGLRLLAATCAREAENHNYLPDSFPKKQWDLLSTPDAMIQAGQTFAAYGFFTVPIQVKKLFGYRGLSNALSSQYSEGCYGIFDPDIPGLITTATGSAKLVDKRSITRHDQAIVVGIKPERDGAVVLPLEGNEDLCPSIEAMEMMGICKAAGTHSRLNSRGETVEVSNVRCILHGHLGIADYDPAFVESVRLDAPYYQQLVSCGTDALANGTCVAFSRSASLQDPMDPRLVIFLEQPGHGIMVIEKWDPQSPEKAPFETLRAYLEAGHIKVSMDVPQSEIKWIETHQAGTRRMEKAF